MDKKSPKKLVFLPSSKLFYPFLLYDFKKHSLINTIALTMLEYECATAIQLRCGLAVATLS